MLFGSHCNLQVRFQSPVQRIGWLQAFGDAVGHVGMFTGTGSTGTGSTGTGSTGTGSTVIECSH